MGQLDEMGKNVKNCNRINNTKRYSIELKCPECGNRDFVDVSM